MGNRNIIVDSGDRYGRLTVVEEVEAGREPNGKPFRRVQCKCECGTVTVVTLHSLRRSLTRSCGCLQKDRASETLSREKHIHGYSGTPTHTCWMGILARCTNPNHTSYRNYGGRGITVCMQWRHSFKAFLKDMGERPAGMTIDRIDNEQGYFKANCRWATLSQQARNRRTNTFLSCDGRTLTLTEWSDITGLARETISNRLILGWTVKEALTLTPWTKRNTA